MGLLDSLTGASGGDPSGEVDARAVPALTSAALAMTKLGDLQGVVVAIQDDTSTTAAQATCKNGGVSFLNPNCRPAKKRKAHALRSSAARLATIEIGTEFERPVAGTNGKSIQAAGLSGAAEERPQSTAALDRAAASAMKSARHARIRQRAREPKGDGSSAFAYAYPYAQNVRQDDAHRNAQNWRWPR
jgi:hypothetical protein